MLSRTQHKNKMERLWKYIDDQYPASKTVHDFEKSVDQKVVMNNLKQYLEDDLKQISKYEVYSGELFDKAYD